MTPRICIFGASGATGLAIAQQALARGHEVTAVVRSQLAQAKLPPGATVVVGSLLDRADVAHAIVGADAVICVFGPQPTSPEVFCAEATQSIIEAMRAHGMRRLICQTGAMISDYPHLSWFMRMMRSSYRKQQPALGGRSCRTGTTRRGQRPAMDDRQAAAPDEWCRAGRVRSGENLKVGAFASISRADLARFMLDEVESPQYVGKHVVVLY